MPEFGPAPKPARVTVHSKPDCVQCAATKREFDRTGADCRVVDVSIDTAARAVLQELGYTSVPVVVVEAGPANAVAPIMHWSGFRPDRIRAAVAGASTERMRSAVSAQFPAATRPVQPRWTPSVSSYSGPAGYRPHLSRGFGD